MRLPHGPDVWLMAAAAMACVRAEFSTIVSYSQTKNVIEELLAMDTEYKELLTEKVKLPVASVPELLRDVFADLDDVHPLYALFSLNKSRTDHYSRTGLDLSLLVLNTAITCRTYKRVAVQVTFVMRLIQLENEKARFAEILSNLIKMFPYNVDLLSNTKERYTNWLLLYQLIMHKELNGADQTPLESDPLGLANNLKSLTDTIKSSCKVGEMKDYFVEFELLDAERLPGIITDDEVVADDVPEADIWAMLTKNQEAIQQFHQKMKLFQKMRLDTWQSILKLPADDKTSS